MMVHKGILKHTRVFIFSFAIAASSVIFGSPSSAFAACADPAGDEGDVIYNAVYNVPQVCTGTAWIAMGELNPSAGGSGCSNPTAGEGEIIYNGDHHVLQYCDGDDWRAAHGNASDGFLAFPDLTGQAPSSLITSNILQVDISGSKSIGISGDGSPEYRICADTTCSTVSHTWASTLGTIDDGEFLQLRLTSNAALATTNSATITVGAASDQWAVTTSGTAIIFLTSGTSWQVPANWNSANNTIEVIGGGGGGDSPTIGDGGGGGGGGGYSKITNLTLTPSASVSYAVGTGGAADTNGGDTYFCNNTSNCASIGGTAVVVGAKGGTAGSNATGGAGGQAGSGFGTTKSSGGSGGTAGTTAGDGGAGGGGAAGPNGAGGNGGVTTTSGSTGAGGGGGANGGSNGLTGANDWGGGGGNNRFGAGGGADDAEGNGADGTAGGGGAGGGDGPTEGGDGSQDTLWTQTSNSATAGPGSGGGGGGGDEDPGFTGAAAGAGGGYGGGGAGAGDVDTPVAGGAGAQGIIIITYNAS